MVALGCDSFQELIDRLKGEDRAPVMKSVVEALTTHKTQFFREREQLDFFREHLAPEIARTTTRPVVWSAGCSTGEEPFTLAMIFDEVTRAGSTCRPRLLATDISDAVLEIARNGAYPCDAFRGVDPARVDRYTSAQPDGEFREFRPEVRRAISFARLNLIGPWPMRGPFDVVFCRNVMIYFEPDVQRKLVERFRRILNPGGYLLVGHSEVLRDSPGLKFVRPTIYRRVN